MIVNSVASLGPLVQASDAENRQGRADVGHPFRGIVVASAIGSCLWAAIFAVLL